MITTWGQQRIGITIACIKHYSTETAVDVELYFSW